MILLQGAIMAVGASEPTVVATKDGRIGMKSQMQVNISLGYFIYIFLPRAELSLIWSCWIHTLNDKLNSNR